MVREITPQEALKKLVKEGAFTAYSNSYRDWKVLITGVNISPEVDKPFLLSGGHVIGHCWIEVPDEYEPYGDKEAPNIKCGDKIKHNNGNFLVTAIEIDKNGLYLTRVGGLWRDNNELYKIYKKADGTPIGKLKTNNNKQIDMVFVEGGTFQMDSTDGESDEELFHSVTVSNFHIGKYPVTQKQWTDVMDSNPSHFRGDNLPVEGISWYQAVEFCNKLSEKEGLTPVYDIKETTVTCNWNAIGYRLPTEAEWEFAARGGNKSKDFTYAGSDNIDEVAWYYSNSGSKTQAVGTKKANELGIYDMSGNVWEWCWDWYGSYSSGAKTNPSGPDSGSDRVLRGGSWLSLAEGCRSAYRLNYFPDGSSSYDGFRVARNF